MTYHKTIAVLAAGLIMTFSPAALAQTGKGGFAKIEAKPATNMIAINNDGNKYYLIDQPFEVSFRISGGSGKHRKTNSLVAHVGDWKFDIPGNKGDAFKKTISIRQVFDAYKMSKMCEQKLEFAAASQNKTKETLRNNGWSTTFDYQLEYEAKLYYRNMLSRTPLGSHYTGTDTREIVVKCLGYERPSDPRPNKPQEPKQVSVTGQLELPSDAPVRDMEVKPPRDTGASKPGPRQTIKIGGRETPEDEILASSVQKKLDDTASSVIGKVGAHDADGMNDKSTSDIVMKGSKIAENGDDGGIALVTYRVGGFGNSEDGQFAFMRLENIGGQTSDAMRIRFTLEARNGEKERVSVQVPPLSPGDTFTAQGSVELESESYVHAIAELPTSSVQYDLLSQGIVEPANQ